MSALSRRSSISSRGPDTDNVWRPLFHVLDGVGSLATDFHAIRVAGVLVGRYSTGQNGVLIDIERVQVDGSTVAANGTPFGFNPPAALTDEQKLFAVWANLPNTLPSSDIAEVPITRPVELAGGYVSEEARAGDKDPLIENVFEGLTGETTAEQQIPGVVIEHNANVAYLIRVGAATEYTIGTALYLLRNTAPLEIGIANFYSKTGADAGKLYRTLDSATNVPLDIWKVNDLAAIRSVIDATGKTAAQIIADIEGETGDDRLDARALKNLPSPHIIEPLDPLRVDEGDEGDVALSDNEFFVISTVGAANTFEGVLEEWGAGTATYLGTSARATSFGPHGQFTSNHDRNIGLLIAGGDVEASVSLWIRAAAFDAGNGQAPASGDTVKALVTADVDGTATTTTTTLGYFTVHDVGGVSYYEFAAVDAACVLHDLDDGDTWSMIVNKADDGLLLSHPANEKHFVEYPVKGIDQYAREQIETTRDALNERLDDGGFDDMVAFFVAVKPWEFVEPDGGIGFREVGRSAGETRDEAVTGALDPDRELVAALRITEEYELDRTLRLQCTIGYFLRKTQGITTSGAVHSVQVSLAVQRSGHADRILRQLHAASFTLDQFNAQYAAVGNMLVYSDTADVSHAVDESWADFSNFDLQKGDLLVFHFRANQINGNALVKIEMEDLDITLTKGL